MLDEKDNIQKNIKYENVLNDPIKMGILKMLEKEDTCSLGYIIQKLRLSNVTGPEHILELRNMGLVNKTGNPPSFQLNKENYAEFIKHFAAN